MFSKKSKRKAVHKNCPAKKLDDEEEELLHAAEVGDLITVARLLETCPNLNVNVTDLMGRTPLRLAASNEHLQVVELLLDRTDYCHIYESLLNAISSDHEDVCAAILKHPHYPEVRHQCQELPAASNTNNNGGNSQFAPEINPIILAAQKNRFETLVVLLQMGESIPHPHAIDCKCEECTSNMEMDELRFARSRLNRYLGLASEAYISLNSDDPVLTAFKLAKELRRVAKVEKYYKNEYRELAERLSDYSVALLNNVRGNDELDVLLNATRGAGVDLACYGRLPRLKLAIHYEEKKFVAHPACQMKLLSIMYGELWFVSHYKFITKILVFMAAILLYPVLVLCYWVAPTTRVGRLVKVPLIKFVAHTASYLIFLLLIITFSMTEKEIQLSQVKLSNFSTIIRLSAPYPNLHRLIQDTTIRPYGMNNYLLWVFIILLCMIWQECKQLYNEGNMGYKASLLNWIDFFLLQCYLASFALRYLVMSRVDSALAYFHQPEGWEQLNNLTMEALTNMYWVNADRYLWDPFDPQCVCEGLFAVANVFSFSRLSYLLAVDDSLGPLQLSLRLMMKDVLKFNAIFLMFVIAFVVGMHNLYWFYEPEVLSHVSRHQHILHQDFPAADAFGSIRSSVRTVFWALFGMADANVVNLGDYPASFTEMVGFFLFATYNWVMVIVMLNMLIAMMSRSYELVTDDQDVEWKFSLTHLYMDYIKDFSTLPPPLNVLPTPKLLIRLFCCCKRNNAVEDLEIEVDTSSGDQTGSQSSIEGTHVGRGSLFTTSPEEGDTGNTLTYKSVIKRVLNRYIEQKVVTSSVVSNEEIKQDLSSFRFEVLGQLKKTEEMSETARSTMKNIETKQHTLEQNLVQLTEQLTELVSLMSATAQGRRPGGRSERRERSRGAERREGRGGEGGEGRGGEGGGDSKSSNTHL